ncbi:MAG: thymidylate synthase [Myxococcota bacterium]
MKQYHDLIRHVLEHGEARDDRTGVGTLSCFGYQCRYDLREGFPLITTKKVLFSAVVRELLWFLRGATNIHDDLAAHTPIWNAWADEDGELGPIYGAQWRAWGADGAEDEGIDQIARAITAIREQPHSRRIIVSAWNVGALDRMALPPCHMMFQFYVSTAEKRLDLQLYQRSADIALGVPFNIASYALLLTMIAQECELTPGVMVHTFGDAHIYRNHVEGLRRQLEREAKPLPAVHIARKPLDQLRFEDITLAGYDHHPFIKFPIAV